MMTWIGWLVVVVAGLLILALVVSIAQLGGRSLPSPVASLRRSSSLPQPQGRAAEIAVLGARHDVVLLPVAGLEQAQHHEAFRAVLSDGRAGDRPHLIEVVEGDAVQLRGRHP